MLKKKTQIGLQRGSLFFSKKKKKEIKSKNKIKLPK